MLRFFVCALLVSVAAANVNPSKLMSIDGLETSSEFSLNPSDEIETATIMGSNFPVFADFCKQSRDYVIDDIRNRGNMFASDVFASIFASVNGVSDAAMEAGKQAAAELTAQIKNPESPIEGDNAIINESKEAIKNANNQVQSVLAAFLGTVKNIGTVGYNTAVGTGRALYKTVSDKAAFDSVVEFCGELGNYESKVQQMFEETKNEIVAEDASLASVTFPEVASQCVTISRLTRLEGFCGLVLKAKDPIAKMLNFGAKSQTNAEQ